MPSSSDSVAKTVAASRARLNPYRCAGTWMRITSPIRAGTTLFARFDTSSTPNSAGSGGTCVNFAIISLQRCATRSFAQPNNASLHFLKGQVYGFERNAAGAESEFRRTLDDHVQYRHDKNRQQRCRVHSAKHGRPECAS